MNQVVATPPVRLPDIALPDLDGDDPSSPNIAIDSEDGLFDWDEIMRGIDLDPDDAGNIPATQEAGAGSGSRTHTPD